MSEPRRTQNEGDLRRLQHELEVHQIELKMQNEELQQARTRAETLLADYTKLYDLAPTSYFSLDPAGVIRRVNLSGASLLGGQRATIVDRRFDLFVAEGDRRTFRAFLERVCVSPTKECCEVTIPQEGATPQFVRLEGTCSEDGRECRVAVVDLTEHRQVEESLVLRARIAASFATIDDEEMFTAVLALVLETMGSPIGLFGYLDEEGALVVPTMTREVWDKCQVPEKTARFPRETWSDSSWPTAIRTRQTVSSNRPSRVLPEGHARIFRHVSVPVVLNDEAIGLFQVANKPTDYTEADIRALEDIAGQVAPILSARVERQRAEQTLRESRGLYHSLVESLPQSVFRKDREGRFLFCNQRFCDSVGRSMEEILGKTDADIFPPALSQAFRRDDLQVMESAETLDQVEESPDRNGGKTFVQVRKSPLFDAAGEIVGVQGVFWDITERRLLEADRVRLQARIQQQQKLESIGTLASGVAHEINNPINGVMGYADIISETAEPGSQIAEFAREIIHETERVATIVRNLLTFARHEVQECHPTPVADIVEGTLSLIRTVIKQDRIRLDVELPPGLPWVRCQGQQIQQVLMNLFTNSRDALNAKYPGHGTDKALKVRVAPFTKEDAAWVRITVEDHGTGIPPEVAERMFEPFFTSKGRYLGTGLGLSISLGIVQEHHGELRCETEVGRYTRFHLELPAEGG